MRILYSLLFSLVFVARAYGQCNYEWNNIDTSVFKCKRQQTKTSIEIPATCKYSFPKTFLDSICNDVYAHPFVFPMGKDKPGVEKDFRIYRYGTTEVVHYKSRKYLINGDTIVISLFSFSMWDGYDGRWVEDARSDFLYTPFLRIIGRLWWSLEVPSSEFSYVRSNSCHSKAQSELLQKIVDVVKGYWKY